jgi:inner membrane protein
MDPLSQGAIGAALAQSSAPPAKLRTAAVLGALAGMAPDLDALIQSPTDPLLFLEYHRQFTHSLAFIPVGALLVAAATFPWARRHMSFKLSYLFCLLGYATHGLLDACTTYGTLLLWPFSDMRVAWSNVSVVDPLFTLPVLTLAGYALRRHKPHYAQCAVLWAVAYLCFGVVQGQRAAQAAQALAASRGHVPVRLETKPAFASLLLWKSIYEHQGRYYVDALRTGVEPLVYAGDSIEKLELAKHFPWLSSGGQQARDVARFERISDGFVAPDPRAANRIVDIRYSMLPNEIDPFWAIELDPNATAAQHVEFHVTRQRAPQQLRRLFEMMF